VQKRSAAFLLSLLLAAATVGCVYYNTFYHARAAYSQAEALRQDRPPGSEPGAAELELLNRAIEKSGRVVKLHPDSGWADDALLLMGSALYHQGKYESAQERLTDLITLYPESDLVGEAEYMKGAVLLAQGNPVSAEGALEQLAFADPPLPRSSSALTLVGRARHARKRYEEASQAYSRALEIAPKGDERAAIRFLAAENYAATGRHDLAAEQYEAIIDEGAPLGLSFDARMALAESRLLLGESLVAMEVLDDVEHRTSVRDDLDRVLLLRGQVEESMGEFDAALDTYESITTAHGKSDASAMAQYRKGLIYRDHLDRLDDASLAFQNANRQSPRSDVGRLASDSARDIARLKELVAIVEAWEAERARVGSVPQEEPAAEEATGSADTEVYGPSLPDAVAPEGPPAESATDERDEEVAEARFRLSEIHLFGLDDPEQALLHYARVVEDHPTSDLAPKAALAIAWISEHKLADLDRALAAYAAVVEGFPGTRYASAASLALERLSADAGATHD
jgi:tetratricopeptide (TPR) repeat protein